MKEIFKLAVYGGLIMMPVAMVGDYVADSIWNPQQAHQIIDSVVDGVGMGLKSMMPIALGAWGVKEKFFSPT